MGLALENHFPCSLLDVSAQSLPTRLPACLPDCLPGAAAHPHTKLATLVYCESLYGDVGLVGDMLNGDMGPALVSQLA